MSCIQMSTFTMYSQYSPKVLIMRDCGIIYYIRSILKYFFLVVVKPVEVHHDVNAYFTCKT